MKKNFLLFFLFTLMGTVCAQSIQIPFWSSFTLVDRLQIGEGNKTITVPLEPASVRLGSTDEVWVSINSTDPTLRVSLGLLDGSVVSDSQHNGVLFFQQPTATESGSPLFAASDKSTVWHGTLPAGSPAGNYRLLITRGDITKAAEVAVVVLSGNPKRIGLQLNPEPESGKQVNITCLLADFEKRTPIKGAAVNMKVTATVVRSVLPSRGQAVVQPTSETSQSVSSFNPSRVVASEVGSRATARGPVPSRGRDGATEVVLADNTVPETVVLPQVEGNYRLQLMIPENATDLKVWVTASWSDETGKHTRTLTRSYPVKRSVAQLVALDNGVPESVKGSEDGVLVSLALNSSLQPACYVLGVVLNGRTPEHVIAAKSAAPVCTTQNVEAQLTVSILFQDILKLETSRFTGNVYLYKVEGGNAEVVAKTKLESSIGARHAFKY